MVGRPRLQATLSLLVVLLTLAWAGPALAQEEEPPEHIVSLYRVAPGQHVAFLEWMAAQEAAAAEAGAPADVWYAHLSGDQWDFVHISQVLPDEQSDAVDAAAEARGLATGPQASIEFRRFVAWHTDTRVAGPHTAGEMLEIVRGGE